MLRIISLLLLHGMVNAQTKLVTSSGCGTVKGCYKMPADCSDVDDCDVMVTWEPVGGTDTIEFELLGKLRSELTEQQVAIGFSHDNFMTDDDVWSCANTENGVAVARFYTTGKELPKPLILPQGSVTNFESVIENSVIQCRFTRPKILAQEAGVEGSPTFDLNEKYILLVARTPIFIVNGVINAGKHQELPIITANKVDFQSVDVVTGVAPRPILLKCHASLMVFGWIGCASIAIMLAKHFKIIWPNSKLCGEKVWFAMHRFLMVTNVLCFVAGFVCVFVYVGGFVQYREMTQTIFIHAACGISATSLGLINPFMALLRPHPGTKRRPYFNWAHWGVGTSAHILAIACVFIGIDLEMLDLPDYAFWAMVGFVLFHVVIDILLRLVIGLAENGVARKQVEQYEMQENKRDSVRHLVSEDKPTPPGSGVAMFLLGTHAFGVIGVTTLLIVLIALM